MKKGSTKKADLKPKGKVPDYPRKDIQSLIPILRKIKDSGGVLTRSQLAELLGVKETGGGFNHIIFAFKLYKILDKEGQSDFRINDLGVSVSLEEKKSILKAINNVPIFRKLNQRYSTLPKTKKVVKDYISAEYKIETNTANTIASRFLKNMKFLKSVPGVIEDEGPELKGEEESTTQNVDFSTYRMLVNMRASIKLGEKSVEDAMNEVKKLNLPAVSGNMIFSNLEKLENKDKESFKEILLALLDLIITQFE